MATGDAQDIAARLRGYLPKWFGRTPEPTPVLDALLHGLGSGFAVVGDLIAFARRQARLATASGGWLDMAAADFFGEDALPRFRGDSDAAYALRIRREVLRRRVTREAFADIVEDLTGAPPLEVFEAWDATTLGGYGAAAGLAYGRAGLYGSATAPGEVIVTLTEPQGYGIPQTPGWGSGFAGYGAAGSNFRYCDDSSIVGAGPTKADIIRAVNGVRGAGLQVWLRFVPPLGFDLSDL